MNKIWNKIASLDNQKSKIKYPKAKRSKEKLIEFAKQNRLKIEWYAYGRYHGISNSKGEFINNYYGVQGSCNNLAEIEEVIEDYLNKNL